MMKDKVVGFLYYDISGSSSWEDKISGEEVSRIQLHCKQFFLRIAKKYKMRSKSVTSRGDDTLVVFDEMDKCVSCGLEYLKNIPRLIRECPNLEDIGVLTPRVIAFADIVSGKDVDTCGGLYINKIAKYERRYSEGGSFRIIGEQSYKLLSSDLKKQFQPLNGKKRTKYRIYETEKKHDTVAISQHHTKVFPFYHERVLKFYSSNFGARNAITMNLIERLRDKKKVLVKHDFTQQILDSCRLFFDSLVAFGDLTPSKSYPPEAWVFKLSYWMPNEDGKLRIYAYSYPDGMECISHKKEIPVAPGENIPGECFSTGKVVVRLVGSPEYKPLHDNRAKGLIAVAAFPVVNPVSGKVEGVLSIDTSSKGVFTGEQIEVSYLEDLLSSFTINLVLANHLG
jgi:hypothetical protein